MNANVTEFNEMVYVPRAVWLGAKHANEGGGGGYASQEEAAALGATNIRPGTLSQTGLIADWPQHYWE